MSKKEKKQYKKQQKNSALDELEEVRGDEMSFDSVDNKDDENVKFAEWDYV